MNATTVEVCNKNQWKFLFEKYNIIIVIEYATTLL